MSKLFLKMAVQQRLLRAFENLILYDVIVLSSWYTRFLQFMVKNTQPVTLAWTSISLPPRIKFTHLGIASAAREMLFFLREVVSPQLWTGAALPVLSHLLTHTRRWHYFKFMWLSSLPNSQGYCGPCSAVQEAASEVLQVFTVWQTPRTRKASWWL